MEVVFTLNAENDLKYLKRMGDSAILKRIKILIKSIIESPFTGIGKPEHLKYQFTGLWSRRINKKDRLIYQIEENRIIILSLIGHYE